MCVVLLMMAVREREEVALLLFFLGHGLYAESLCECERKLLYFIITRRRKIMHI